MNRRPLSCENLESRDLLTTIFVTSDADSGSGSFREAVEAANADADIDRIAFTSSVQTVELESSVEYTGSQNLMIYGRGVTVTTTADQAGAIDLLVSSGDANLGLRDLTLQGGAKGFYAPISSAATDEINFLFFDVAVRDNALHGIHLDDQLNDSDASLRMFMKSSTVVGNGVGDLDYDGVRVDEGGMGGIQALVFDSVINENGGDGLELDERGDGRVWMMTRDSSYDGNGFFNEADLDDGLDIDEAGAGDLWFRAAETSFSNNFDQGLDLDEEQDGWARVHLFRVNANGNLGEGIKVDEKFDDEDTGSDGNLFALFIQVNANLNQSEEGIALTEEGTGRLLANFVNVNANQNGKEGISIDEEGDGTLNVVMRRVNVLENAEDGLDISEAGAGRFLGLGVRVSAQNNGGFGAKLEQEDAGTFDFGRWVAVRDAFSGNADGNYHTVGVRVI